MNQWTVQFALVVSIAFATHGSSARAQSARDSAGENSLTARTFELRPREGLAHQLEIGYQHHLDWHIQNGDRATWYMWQVTNGERSGLYVDGTFNHDWKEFDAPVDPVGDAADNAVNVEPSANRAANQVWRLRLESSSDDASFEGSRFVLWNAYYLRPGRDSAFLAVVNALKGDTLSLRFKLLELVSGGDSPVFVVWVPANTWREVGTATEHLARSRLSETMNSTAERIRRELWRFRPDLSICATVARHCYRTGPSPSRVP
jgi:hypothetical protein